jgi:hypothetical protein
MLRTPGSSCARFGEGTETRQRPVVQHMLAEETHGRDELPVIADGNAPVHEADDVLTDLGRTRLTRWQLAQHAPQQLEVRAPGPRRVLPELHLALHRRELLRPPAGNVAMTRCSCTAPTAGNARSAVGQPPLGCDFMLLGDLLGASWNGVGSVSAGFPPPGIARSRNVCLDFVDGDSPSAVPNLPLQ